MIHLLKKPWYYGEVCQEHPLFLSLGLHSAAFREAVRLLDAFRREDVSRCFPAVLMGIFHAVSNYCSEEDISQNGVIFEGKRYYLNLEGTVKERAVNGEMERIMECPWRDEGIYANGPYDLVTVDGVTYKKPSMAKAMYIFEFVGAHGFFYEP